MCRVVRDAVTATLHRDAWPVPPLFQWLQRQGNVSDEEMARVFNCGIGMVVVIAPEHVGNTLNILRNEGETAWEIGEIGNRLPGQAATLLV